MASGREEWGGRREGAGRKPGWQSGKCKAVKLPVVLLDRVLAYARQLDAGAVVPEVARPARRKPAQEVSEAAAKWEQVAKLVDEKAELRRKLEHQGKLLAGELKKRLREEEGRRALQARIEDACSVLRQAYDEQLRGARKGIRVGDVRSALLALGVDVESF